MSTATEQRYTIISSDTHAGGSPLLPAAEVPPGPAPPAAELAWVPVPSRLGLLPPGLELENPTAAPSWWTKASQPVRR